MRRKTHSVDEREMELVGLLMTECKITGDIHGSKIHRA